MTEGHEEEQGGAGMYYTEENPYSNDLFARPDLFYGNPDDNLNDSTERYPSNGLYYDTSASQDFNGYGEWEDEIAGHPGNMHDMVSRTT